MSTTTTTNEPAKLDQDALDKGISRLANQIMQAADTSGTIWERAQRMFPDWQDKGALGSKCVEDLAHADRLLKQARSLVWGVQNNR